MKAYESARSTSSKTPSVGVKPSPGQSPSQGKKPVGPMTYSVSKGSNVFWSGKDARKK